MLQVCLQFPGVPHGAESPKPPAFEMLEIERLGLLIAGACPLLDQHVMLLQPSGLKKVLN